LKWGNLQGSAQRNTSSRDQDSRQQAYRERDTRSLGVDDLSPLSSCWVWSPLLCTRLPNPHQKSSLTLCKAVVFADPTEVQGALSGLLAHWTAIFCWFLSSTYECCLVSTLPEPDWGVSRLMSVFSGHTECQQQEQERHSHELQGDGAPK